MSSNSPKPSKATFFLIGLSLLLTLAVIILVIILSLSNYQKSLDSITQDDSSTPEDTQTPTSESDATRYTFDYSWTKHPYVAHALGGIFGTSYTNSYEAFLLNYSLGHRVFEVDLTTTDDGVTIASHGSNLFYRYVAPSPDTPFTSASAKTYLFDGCYHLLDYRGLINLLVQFPDAYLITDSGNTNQTDATHQLTELINYANSINHPEVLDRLIIQIYNQPMLDWIMQIHPWKSIIYTLYSDPDWTPENVVAFAESSGVQLITIWGSWLTPEIANLFTSANLKIAAHTINDATEESRLRNLGVSLIYTDFLIPTP